MADWIIMGEGQNGLSKQAGSSVPLTLEDCEETHQAQELDTSLRAAILREMEAKKQWGVKGWGKFLLNHIPAVRWLRHYRWKDWIVVDILAGLTVGTMNVPQGMAYAMLAMQAPVNGLYLSLFFPLIYAFFGTSKHVAGGSLAVISLMTGSAVLKHAQEEAIPVNISTIYLTSNNISDSAAFWCGASGGTKTSVDPKFALEIGVVLSLMVALTQLILGFLRLGFFTVLLSDELLQGLTTGAAFHVFTSQTKAVFGMPLLPRPTGSFGIFKFWGCWATRIHTAQWLPMTISVCCIIVLLICKKVIDPRTQKKIKFPIPGELIILVITTFISWKLNLKETQQLAVVGSIPHGIQTPEIPKLGKWFSVLFGEAVSIAIVSYAIEVSVAKHFARIYGYEIDANQELFGLGLAHLVGSFFNCFPGGASVSRTMVQGSQGGKSQISSWVNSLVVLFVLVTVAGFLEQLPKCTLAAIIWVALLKLFMQIGGLPQLYKKSRTDFMIWVVTCLAVVLFDVKLGVLIGAAFALFCFVFRFLWPSTALLERLEGTDYFDEGKSFCAMENFDRTIVIRFNSPVFYGNAIKFKEEIYKISGIDPTVVRHKQDIEERKMERKLKKMHKEAIKNEPNNNSTNGDIGEPLDPQIDVRMPAVKPSVASLAAVMNKLGASTTHVIIDCSALCFVDIMGSNALAQVYNEFKLIGISVFFVNITASVRQSLSKCEFFETVRKRHVIPTLNYAVTLAANEQRGADLNEDEEIHKASSEIASTV